MAIKHCRAYHHTIPVCDMFYRHLVIIGSNNDTTLIIKRLHACSKEN